MSMRDSFRTLSALGFLRIAFAILPCTSPAEAALPSMGGGGIPGGYSDPKPAKSALKAAFPPVQLELRTPFEPTVYSDGSRKHLLYEVHLHNFSKDPLHLQGLEVVNPEDSAEALVDAIQGARLHRALLSTRTSPENTPFRLEAGQTSVAFLDLTFEGHAPVPRRLRHRALLEGAVAEGPVIGTHHDTLQVLGRPLAGNDWAAIEGPGIDSHHRTGLWVAGGLVHLSRRYAIDWKQFKQGATHAGDALDVHSYYAYGQAVLAVAAGTVVFAKDGLPDNVPRTAAGFQTAVPITLETVAGNTLVIDLGGGHFAHYAHLQAGSLRVQVGSKVLPGQRLARIGNSGDAREPHLHFQVSNGPDILASEGLPYLLNHFRSKATGGTWETRTRAFPTGDAVIDFGPGVAGIPK